MKARTVLAVLAAAVFAGCGESAVERNQDVVSDAHRDVRVAHVGTTVADYCHKYGVAVVTADSTDFDAAVDAGRLAVYQVIELEKMVAADPAMRYDGKPVGEYVAKLALLADCDGLTGTKLATRLDRIAATLRVE